MKSRFLRSSPSAAPRFTGWRSPAGFRDQLTSRRTAGYGSRTRSSLGKTRLTNSIRSGDEEKVAAIAVELAAKSLRDLRVAEVVKLDMQLDAKGKVEAYRAKLNVSFKFEGS